ncbi:ABC transporter substrate-binding protein [Paenibacillus naphthalenovorans]|uniref:ABC transporter substrate-binding protein n=1 Tax=Paenibacillus naphthalenovorans TaxID=162209 RepID=UPI0008868B0A|nr:ABC transporter substrate-binding protein [Paenibacillus naphthalenovorans]SDJ01974.1 NitT/TauT family transport system substrate-binding protein [Paenibacillus naphthalenovorans]
MRKVKIVMLAVMLHLSTLLMACGTNTTTQETQKETPKVGATQEESPKPVKNPFSINVAISKFTTNAPLFIAMEKGFFKDENLDVTFKFLDSGQAINVAVASGSADVGAGGFSADLYNMISAGEKVVAVADKGREEKTYHYSAIVVREDDSEIKSIKDLKGKKIGLTSIGSANQYNIGMMLEKNGLNSKDVQWVSLNSVSGLMEALKGKNLDVIGLSEPNVSIAIKEGYGKVLAWVSDEISPQSAAIFFSSKFAGNEDASVRFLKAFIKGSRYYYDAVLAKKDGNFVKGSNYEEVIGIISKYSEQPKERITVFPYIDPDGKMNVEDIKEQINWYFKENYIKQMVDPKDFVNTELLEKTLKEMGE